MITIEGVNFEGPYADSSKLRRSGGVYVITDSRSNGHVYLLDVGESESVRDRIENHDRKHCWLKHKQGALGVAVHIMPGSTVELRRQLEGRIRSRYKPGCGEI